MPDPILLCTWSFGREANRAGWPFLSSDSGSSLDAVEHTCRHAESDPENMTVGRGGRPDASGQITLDAAVMMSPNACGAVCCVKRFLHPVSIARRVMERTPHTLLAGEGAERFAQSQGMTPTELSTKPSREAYTRWAAGQTETVTPDIPKPNIEQDRPHDTIAALALDRDGRLAAACSTSGWPFKLPGRVGDSPLVGQGLYVDPRHGAAVATGAGELISGVCGSFLAVEMLRRGATPLEAAIEVLQRIEQSYSLDENHQVAILVLDVGGRFAAAAIRHGYTTAVRTSNRDELVEPDHLLLPNMPR